MTTVWTVSSWHTPWVEHGSEVVAIFGSQKSAQSFADDGNARNGVTPLPKEQRGGYYANEGELTVEEWEVQS